MKSELFVTAAEWKELKYQIWMEIFSHTVPLCATRHEEER